MPINRPGGASYRPLLALAVLPWAAGCVSSTGAIPPVAPSSAAFDPIAFFAGTTHGTGVLHILTSGARTTDVKGRGVRDGADAITLDQDVVQGNKPVTHRMWRLRRIAPGRYTGTLTDAVGPVIAESRGGGLDIAFTMRHGLRVVQHLYLQPGGHVAQNTMIVRKWGVVVARLDERIERL